MRFVKRPVVIDAVRWTGRNIAEVLALVDFDRLPATHDGHIKPGIGCSANDGALEIPTLEGVMRGRVGDWIIRGVAGEIYPCRAEIFDATYDRDLGDTADRLRWRVGRKVPRNIYAVVGDEASDADLDIGRMDTASLAEAAVRAHNLTLKP